MPKLITLTGPSQAGKSTAIQLFKEHKRIGYNPVSIPKYSTRDPRDDDSPEEILTCSEIPSSCNLVYQQYDVRYGIDSKSITEALSKGQSPIIVINDVRTISEIRRIFGEISTTVFIYREPPSYDTHKLVSDTRGVADQNIINKRLKKAESIYRIYIENIYLFDHVIVNSKDVAQLDHQISSIIDTLSKSSTKRIFI
ncbi:MAG: hypothetical protein JKY81_09390 [Colwellia sp.]|nr:hypothetical protein [Colwellia sp.]